MDRSYQGKAGSLFRYYHLLLDGKQWWAFYIFFHYFAFFFALHNGLPANARPLYPGTLECLYVLFFYNLFFRLDFVFATNLAGTWLDWVFFFLVCLFVAFVIIHEIDYGVVCLYGAWSMEHYGILRGE